MRTQTPGISDGQYAWRTSLNREGNFFHGKGGVMEVGEGFNDELGYYRRTSVRKWFTDVGFRPRPEALRRLGNGRAKGKLVIAVEGTTDPDGPAQ